MITVNVNQSGRVFQIRFPYDPKDFTLQDWARELTGCRWDAKAKNGKAWVCAASPAMAEEIKRTCPGRLNPSARFTAQLATFIDNAFGKCSEKDPDQWELLDQPERRVHDSWLHQVAAYQFAQRMKWQAMLAMGMGTGKSKVLIDGVNNLPLKFVLLLCPPTVLAVWRREFRQFALDRCEIEIIDDSFSVMTKKLKRAQEFVDYGKRQHELHGDRPFVLAINYESARTAKFAKWALDQQWCLTALDESQRAKNSAGVTGKFIAQLRWRSARRVCLTGTPMTHSPADIFAQYAFVDPTIFGRSFFRFKRRFAIEGYFKEITGWVNSDELSQKFHSAAFLVGDEVLDLPEVQFIDRTFKLPKKAQRIHDEIWNDLCSDLDADDEDGGTVSVANVLVKLIRCQQVTSGFVPKDPEINPFSDSDGEKQSDVEIEEVHDLREKMLEDQLRDIPDDDCVCVFCRWRHDLDVVRAVTERLEWERNGVKFGNQKRRFEKEQAGTWKSFRYGEVSGLQKDLTDEAKIKPGINVLGVQVQSGGVGVDFTLSAIGILFSLNFSFGDYEQLVKRQHRPGQERPVRFYHYIAEQTVDERIRTALKKREGIIRSIQEKRREEASS